MDLKLLLVPFAALFGTQFIKIIIDSRKGKFSWSDLNSYGGMPSSHSAFIGAALTESVQQLGIASPIFAVIAFLAFVVLRDAVGLRQEVGNQAKIINQLIIDLPDNLEEKYPRLETRIGHTYTQVYVGLAIGILISVAI